MHTAHIIIHTSQVMYVYAHYYNEYALYSCAGVGGNLVAVQASRISTALHSCGPPGTFVPSRLYRGPLRTFFSKGVYSNVVHCTCEHVISVNFVLGK